MNLSASAIMASHLSKAQVNNYVNYSPTKTHYSSSTELARDLSTRPSPQYTSSSQRYSPELEGLRRELNDQMRNYFYSLSGDITVLKKDSSESKGQFDDLRRELDSMNSKLAQLKISNTSELQQLREVSSKENNWVRSDRKSDDALGNLSEVNEKIYQISRQIHTLNGEMETLKRPNYVSKEQFSRTMENVIDELERKLQIINERVRERIEEMDISLVRSQNEKEKDVNRLYTDLKNMQTSIAKFNDQVNGIARDSEANVEDQVRKMMNSFSSDFRNISSTGVSSAEHKHKGYKKDEHSILGSSTFPYQNKEIEVKIRELDSISQTIGLLEKEMRAKIDMVDLNINSVKRNLELELSIQLKHMVLPIQKNLEQYLQSTESRFSALEDAVLNHMKRDSYIMTAERASRLRGSGSLDLRGSNFEEVIQFATKPGFNNISAIDPHAESRQDKKASQPDSRVGSGLKDRGRDKDRLTTDAFRIEEVDSVLSMNETLQSTLKGEGRYARGDDARHEHKPSYQIGNHDTLEAEEEEEEEEAPSTNTAKELLNDKDRNKKQKKAEEFFKDLETKPLPETMFRDFPSTSAMKSALEMEHPDNKVQDRAGSAKKKKPEIDVGNTHKNALRDAPKKPGSQASPFNKLALTTNAAYIDDDDEEEQAPPLRKNDIASKGREEPDNFGDDADEFQGNIKGLLRKSRNKKEQQFHEEEEKPAAKQKGKFEQEAPAQKYGKEPVTDAFKKHPPLPKKDFEKTPVQKELPPVDTKSMKNFNKGNNNLGAVKGAQGKGLNQPGNMGYQRGFDSSEAWGMQQGDEEEGESVEEIVYNVDEEGFLIDEQGNYLVDEQGNFLQLSPEQMREIEDRDLVYEKEF